MNSLSAGKMCHSEGVMNFFIESDLKFYSTKERCNEKKCHLIAQMAFF